MTTSELRLVIFDCDGTLVDSFAAIHEAMAAAFRDFGLPAPAPDRLRAMIGLSVAEQVMVLAPDADADLRLALENGYRRHRLGRHDPHEPLFPGARACLEALDRREILMAVATAKSAKGLRATLDLHGLGHFFANLQSGDRHPGKPNPAMVLTALAETGVAPASALLVGDTRYDVEMAVNAGVTPIGVGWGYHAAEELAAAGAITVVPSFAALTEMIIERLPNQ
ncbi:MAG: HAD-IA family hydrolase [Proteobacteria bacterium]|nr:HAD-IA family hydrolase [Pseudomonadota bacterium]MDA1059523.1 HAD-IA family hydrolase [Pseudomonadota bacterium]